MDCYPGVALTLKVDLSWTRWGKSVLITSCPGGGLGLSRGPPGGVQFFGQYPPLTRGGGFWFSRAPPPGGYLLWNVEYIYTSIYIYTLEESPPLDKLSKHRLLCNLITLPADSLSKGIEKHDGMPANFLQSKQCIFVFLGPLRVLWPAL